MDKEQQAINKEINRLSLQMAVIRCEMHENILKEIPIGFWKELGHQYATLGVQRYALETGRFKELPYNVRQLYSHL